MDLRALTDVCGSSVHVVFVDPLWNPTVVFVVQLALVRTLAAGSLDSTRLAETSSLEATPRSLLPHGFHGRPSSTREELWQRSRKTTCTLNMHYSIYALCSKQLIHRPRTSIEAQQQHLTANHGQRRFVRRVSACRDYYRDFGCLHARRGGTHAEWSMAH